MKTSAFISKSNMMLGFVGFMLGFLLSSLAGNLWETSLERGGIGFIILYSVGWLLRQVWISGLKQAEQIDDDQNQETPESEPVDQTLGATINVITENDADKMVQLLRNMTGD